MTVTILRRRTRERRSSLSFFLWVGKKVMICRKEREVAAGSKSSPGGWTVFTIYGEGRRSQFIVEKEDEEETIR